MLIEQPFALPARRRLHGTAVNGSRQAYSPAKIFTNIDTPLLSLTFCSQSALKEHW
jgi:hypothetical protein